MRISLRESTLIDRTESVRNIKVRLYAFTSALFLKSLKLTFTYFSLKEYFWLLNLIFLGFLDLNSSTKSYYKVNFQMAILKNILLLLTKTPQTMTIQIIFELIVAVGLETNWKARKSLSLLQLLICFNPSFIQTFISFLVYYFNAVKMLLISSTFKI